MKGNNESRAKGMRQKTQTALISIEDPTSEAVAKLAQSFREIPRVESVAFNLELPMASVEFEPQQCSVDTLYALP
jgi:hypothetical protein